MSDAIFTPNAMWWGQMHLLGGPRRLATIGFVYASILAAAILGFRYVDRDGVAATTYYDGVLTVLTVIQMLLIVVVGANAVYKALARDITSRMLESHRLSPISAAAAVIGWLVGANLQVLMLYVIGAICGAVTASYGTNGAQEWIVGNAYMLAVAPLAWSATLLLGIGRPKPTSPTAIMFLLMIAGPGLVGVPGFGLLTGIYAGGVGAALMHGSLTVPPGAAVILALTTVGMTVVCVRGTMRKFRRPDLPAFGTLRAIGLLLIWLVTSAVGVRLIESGAVAGLGQFLRISDFDPRTIVTITMAAALLFSIMPVLAAAHTRVRVARRGKAVYRGDLSRITQTPLLCATLIVAFGGYHQDMAVAGQVDFLYVFLAVACALVTIEGLLTVCLARNMKAAVLVAIYIILFWGFPVVSGLGYAEYRQETSEFGQSFASLLPGYFTWSPVGSITTLFSIEDVVALPGLPVQAAIALVVWFWGYRSLRRVTASR